MFGITVRVVHQYNIIKIKNTILISITRNERKKKRKEKEKERKEKEKKRKRKRKTGFAFKFLLFLLWRMLLLVCPILKEENAAGEGLAKADVPSSDLDDFN